MNFSRDLSTGFAWAYVIDVAVVAGLLWLGMEACK